MVAQSTPSDGTLLAAGQFRFHFDDERWDWSAEVAQIHGYPAEEMHPTTEQVMWHKHPDDYAKMAVNLDQVRRTRESINTRHRIVDVHGATREVAVVGQRLYDDAGNVVGTHGFYVDVSPSGGMVAESEHERNRKLDEAVTQITERRSAIDELKGMLMLVYRVSDDTAFGILRWRSQETNTKVRLLAEQLLDDFTSLDYDETLPSRSTFDDLLLTAHLRIAPVGATA